MAEYPYISVIIPFYNAFETLSRSVASCLEQTYSNFEVILVDDGSTDDSVSLAKDLSLQSEKVRLIETGSNQGVASARNKGICAANGDVVAFLDADDYWHFKKLEIMAGVILKYDGINIFFHDTAVSKLPVDINVLGDDDVEFVSFYRFLIRNPAHTPSVMIRNKSCFRFSNDMHFSEDYDLWLRAAFPDGAIRVKRILAAIDREVGSAGGLSSRRWKMRIGEIRSYARLYKLNMLLCFLFPALIVWSLVKHIRSGFVSKPGC